MSDYQQDPTWWQASDGKWYPPQQAPATAEQASWGSSGQQQWGSGQAAPQPYASQPYAQYQPAQGSGLPSVNGLAVASMVLGIVSLVFCWCWPVGGTCAIVGLPLGAIAMSKISKGEADPAPKGMAVAGLVMNIISVALIIIVVIWINAVATSPAWYID